jgi:DNA primase
MAFPPRFLDELRARTSLAGLVGKRVKLVRKGREWSGLCPFHNEKTPSFYVAEEKGFFHCFGCGAHGDAIGFCMRTEGLSFPEAVERLARDAGLDVPQARPEDVARAQREKTLHEANEAAQAWFAGALKAPSGRAALDYLRGRGLADETIERFRLGYAPEERDGLKRALLGKGFTEALLLEAGLVIQPEEPGRSSFDRFRGRVMFPIADRRGRVVAFGGRVMGDGQPKYLNSPETPLFHKGRMLYALALAREAAAKGQTLVVAEGYMDVIALHQAGFGAAVAPLGTALTEAQIEELWRLAPEPVLCFDGDNAGRRAALRAAERVLPLLKPGHSLRFAFLPEGQDPDSLVRDRGAEPFQALLAAARPLADFLWESAAGAQKLDTPERRAALRQTLMARAAEIAERSVQQQYVAEFERRLAAAFAPPARARGTWRGPDRAGHGRRTGGLGAALDPGLKGDGDVGRLALRARQALLAAVLNHPELIEEISESLAKLDFGGARELDRLRQEILAPAASGLDSGALRNHLIGLDFSAALDRVLSREVYELHPFAAPAASAEKALAGWRDLFGALAARPALDREVERAGRDLVEDMTERSWGRLAAVKRQAVAARGVADSPAEDGTEAADGRVR